MNVKTVYKYSALAIGVILVLFLLLMASDTFEKGISWYNLAGFFVQSIPADAIAGATVLGYFRPRLGSVVFLLIAAAFTFYFHTYREILTFLVVSFPPIVISVLLFLSSRREN